MVAFAPYESGVEKEERADGDHSIRIADATSGRELCRISGYIGQVTSLVFSSTGHRPVSGDCCDSLIRCDSADGKRIWESTLEVENRVGEAAYFEVPENRKSLRIRGFPAQTSGRFQFLCRNRSPMGMLRTARLHRFGCRLTEKRYVYAVAGC